MKQLNDYSNLFSFISSSKIAKDESSYNSDSANDFEESELDILTSGCASWNEVLTMWKKTHSFRQNELVNDNMKIGDYIDKYVVILNEKSYELVSSLSARPTIKFKQTTNVVLF